MSRPENPTLIKYYNTYPPTSNALLSGTVAYLPTNSGILVVDISNPSALVGKQAYLTVAQGRIALFEDLLYVPNGLEGLKIIDVREQAHFPLHLVGNYKPGGFVQGVAPTSTSAFVLTQQNLYIVDVRNLPNFTLTATMAISSDGSSIVFSNSFAYITAGSAGLFIIDVHDLFNPVLIWNYKPQRSGVNGYITNLAFSGITTYAADSLLGVHIIDKAVPNEEPILIHNHLRIHFLSAPNGLNTYQLENITLATNNLYATDIDSDINTLLFRVSNITGGYFISIQSPRVTINSFEQQRIIAGQIRFIYLDGKKLPSYQVTVDDGYGAAPNPPNWVAVLALEPEEHGHNNLNWAIPTGIVGGLLILVGGVWFYRKRQRAKKQFTENKAGLEEGLDEQAFDKLALEEVKKLEQADKIEVKPASLLSPEPEAKQEEIKRNDPPPSADFKEFKIPQVEVKGEGPTLIVNSEPSAQKLYEYGNERYAQHRYSEAQDFYEQSLKCDSHVAEVHYAMGLTLHQRGRYNDAIISFERALKINDKLVSGWYFKGLSSKILNQESEATTCYEEAYRLDSNSAPGLTGKGEISYHLKQYQQAQVFYDYALIYDSKFEPALTGKGYVLYHLGQFEAALQYFEDALKSSPQSIRAHTGKGNVFFKLEKYQDSQSSYINATQIYDKYAPPYKGRDDINYKSRLHQEAINYYNVALRIDSKYVDAYIGKGIVLYERKEYKNAHSCFAAALELDQKLETAYVGSGNALFHLDKLNEAKASFDNCLEFKMDSIEALVGNGNVLAKLGDFEGAKNYYEKALSCNEQCLAAQIGKGEAHHKLGEYKDALSCYKIALDIDKRCGRAHHNKGDIHFRLGEYKDALDSYDAALREGVRSASLFLNRGNAFYKLAKYSEALESYKEVLAIETTCVDACKSMGDAHFMIWKSSATWNSYAKNIVTFYNKAVALDPNSLSLEQYENKASALFSLGDYPAATKCYDRILHLRPIDKDLHNSKGRVLTNLKRYDEALCCYEAALKIDSQFLTAQLNQGETLFHLGHYQKAFEVFEAALKLHPNLALVCANNGKANVLFRLHDYAGASTCFRTAVRCTRTDSDNFITAHELNANYLLPREGEAEAIRLQRYEADICRRLQLGEIQLEKEEAIEYRDLAQELLKLKFTPASTLTDLQTVNQKYKALEMKATKLRYANFYTARGEFYLTSAKKFTDNTRKKNLYECALKDFETAMHYDPFLENITQQIKDTKAKVKEIEEADLLKQEEKAAKEQKELERQKEQKHEALIDKLVAKIMQPRLSSQASSTLTSLGSTASAAFTTFASQSSGANPKVSDKSSAQFNPQFHS